MKVRRGLTVLDRTAILTAYARAAGLVVAATGVMVLVGWAGGMERLTWLVTGAAAMKANTAVAFVLAGTSLWIHARSPSAAGSALGQPIALACAIGVAAISGLTLLTYATGGGSWLHELFVRETVPTPGGLPGRMAFLTAAGLLVLAVSLIAIRYDGKHQFLHAILAVPVMIVGLIGLASYLYDGLDVWNFLGYRGMALHTAGCFFLLGTAIMASRGDRGPMAVLTASTFGGGVARRLLPWVFLAPLIVGALQLYGERHGMFGSEFGLALSTVVNIGVFATAVWWSALSLHRTDSERRHASEAISRSEHRFRSLIDQSADAIALIDADGRFTYHSASAARVYGLDPQTLSGVPFSSRLHPDDIARAEAELRGLIAAPSEPLRTEVRFQHGDGSWHWMEATMTNLLHDPAVGNIVLNFRDVTASRVTEDARRATELRFRQMAEHIREAFFVVDLAADQPLYVSPMWAELADRPLADAYDPAIWAAVIHPEDRDRMAATLARIKAGQVVDEQYRMVRPDGTFRWVRGRAFPVRNAAGEVYRYVGASADVTELRQTQERFTQAQKMDAVGRLAGGVAHDFNNLLTVILGESEMLRRELGPGSAGVALVESIQRAGQSAAGLTRQLLAFSRKQLIEPTVFDINGLVADTGAMLSRLIGEHIRLTTHFVESGAHIRADRGQIAQILTNLAVNARDAMPNGGSLTITTSVARLDSDFARTHPSLASGDFVILAVSDTGFGMNETVRTQAFEPFFSTKDRGQGTGLGLSTCLGIARQAGGDISIYSEPGLGTTVRVYLPVVTAETSTPAVVSEVPTTGTETILAVEDDNAVRGIVCRILSELGYTVLEAREGREAQQLLDLHGRGVQLLFTDVILPGMSGRALAEWTTARYPHIRVLYATGYTEDVVLQHDLVEHHVAVLQKPYTRAELAVKIRSVLQEKAVTPR